MDAHFHLLQMKLQALFFNPRLYNYTRFGFLKIEDNILATIYVCLSVL